MVEIIVNGIFYGYELKDMLVINLGEWFGKIWFIEIGGGYLLFFFIVEVDSLFVVIDELVDSEKYGYYIVVEEVNFGDYWEEDWYYGVSGQVFDLDYLMIYGYEGSEILFLCMYYGDGLLIEGVKLIEFCWDEIEV